MGAVSKQLGYKYIAICDHSKALKVAKGISEQEIRNQIDEIQKLNDKFEDFFILSGIELNIDSNGKLDIRNELLKDLNIVIASIHTGFKQEEKKISDRIITAMHNDYVNVIGHPTGRIINERASYKVNLTQIFEIASDLGTFLEINAYPDRLDLSDINCFIAKKFNLKFTIGTDAHSVSELNFLKYGVATARRGWLEKNDILNTMNLNELKGFINI
jgi:DNA polymerase (family 10)